MDRIRRLVHALLIAVRTPALRMLGLWAASGLIAIAQGAAVPALPVLPVLCWHDIRDASAQEADTEIDTTTVATRDLVAQFELLRVLGYTPISLSQWQNAREGRDTLPAKPVLLSFDDGFKSLYTRVFPLLKLYRYPAVASIVSEWMESEGAAASALVSWQELREMSASGWVEVASHTHAMHNGVPANPQGNELPASVSRIFADGTYETDAQYEARLFADLDLSRSMIQQHLGVSIRTLVWPYGEYSGDALSVARRAGFSFSMGLSSGVNTAETSLMQIKRTQVLGHHGTADLIRALQMPPQPYAQTLGTLRTLSIALDDVYHPVAELQELALANLLETVRRIGVNTVILRAWSEEVDSGGVRQVYFPSRSLPMKADLLSRAAWQLRHRAEVQVWIEWPAQQSDGFEELGKHVSMSGLVLQVPTAALDDPNYPWAEQDARLAQARRWRPDLATAVAVQIDTDRGSGLRILEQAIDADFLVIRSAASTQSKAMAGSAGTRAVPVQQGFGTVADRLIFEVSSIESLPSLAAPASEHLRLDALLAGGARHIGYQTLRSADLSNQIESLWPRLSTATLRRPRQ